MSKPAKQEAPARAGWDFNSWCPAADIAKATVYKLPPELRPHSVKIGKRRVIRESPADWLARIAKTQEAIA